MGSRAKVRVPTGFAACWVRGRTRLEGAVGSTEGVRGRTTAPRPQRAAACGAGQEPPSPHARGAPHRRGATALEPQALP